MKQFSLQLVVVAFLLSCFTIGGNAQVVIMSNASSPIEVGDAETPTHF